LVWQIVAIASNLWPDQQADFIQETYRSNAKQFNQCAAEDGFLLGITQGRRV
jgi:hypothetical protein